MNLYLAKVTLSITPYMGRSRSTDVLKLIQAPTYHEAIEKLHAFYEEMSSDYGDSYVVTGYELDEAIA